LINWAHSNGLLMKDATFIGILHDDLCITAPENCRYFSFGPFGLYRRMLLPVFFPLVFRKNMRGYTALRVCAQKSARCDQKFEVLIRSRRDVIKSSNF